MGRPPWLPGIAATWARPTKSRRCRSFIYVGHDNNRDGYLLNMIESQTVVKTQMEYWPLIMYTQHKTAPFPGRIYLPPYGEPISGNINPLMWRWSNKLGTSMAAYLDGHGMPGSMHQGRFDVRYSGYLDNLGNWRNQLSFFTETALYRYATPHFNLRDRFDTIIIPDIGARTMNEGFAEGSIPGQYAGGLGAHERGSIA